MPILEHINLVQISPVLLLLVCVNVILYNLITPVGLCQYTELHQRHKDTSYCPFVTTLAALSSPPTLEHHYPVLLF